MKKIMISLLMVAATLTAMAQSFSGFAELTLTSSDNKSCTLIIAESADLNAGTNNGYYAELSEEGKAVQLYVIFENKKYEQFASKATTMQNLPLGIKTNASTSYRLTAANVEGAISVMINGVEYTVTNDLDVQITLPANSTLADIANYRVNPTACTPVRNGLVANRYYTICLPKAVISADGASFWSMKYRNAEGSLAYLVEEQFPLVAGRPYIFQADVAELCVVYDGDPVNGPSVEGALVGTFAAMDQDDLNAAATNASSDIYLLNSNELWKVNGQSGNNLPAYRAYVVYNNLIPGNPQSAPGRRVRAIPMQTNGATAFENVDVEAAKAVKFMEDGKIFIKRGDAIYNLQGQLVK